MSLWYLTFVTQTNIKWEISNVGGLPTVRFDLPFNAPPDPVPPPNYTVPELAKDPPHATKASDIYCTPYVLAELIKRIEAVVGISVGISKRRTAQPGDHSFVCHPTPDPTPASEAELLVIKRNPLLSGIVTKCLSPDPSQRPTARALRDQLLSVCRKSIFAAIGSDLWKT
ncbi:hypothetical protein M413DRAFT_443371 [Hebeloma cylindrosporum]|uniref:Protein kinase domain-containing protein n=1 Tax=Hebeloma cylindrosporum TaxID=76867 RepID=A0A0C3C3D6_HEBCY|nr:hypothetical protein M413DRAFT_443371 [Hebeloma cylindrosporum h7]